MSLQAKDPSHARRVPRWGFNYLKASVFEIKHIKSRMQNTIVLLDKLTGNKVHRIVFFQLTCHSFSEMRANNEIPLTSNLW